LNYSQGKVTISYPSGSKEVKLKNHVFIIDIQAPGGSGGSGGAGSTLNWKDNYTGGGGGGGAFVSFLVAFGTKDSTLASLQIKYSGGNYTVALTSNTGAQTSSAITVYKGGNASGKTAGVGGKYSAYLNDQNERNKDIEALGVYVLTANNGGNGGSGCNFETLTDPYASANGVMGDYAGSVNIFPLSGDTATLGSPGLGGYGIHYTAVGQWTLYGGGGGGGSAIGRGGQGGGISYNASTGIFSANGEAQQGYYGGGGGGGACINDTPQSGAAGGGGYVNIYW
jgi:hypothetical protein